MIAYLDASALVKCYVEEDGSPAVRRLLSESIPAISRITAVEITSALSRRCRNGECTVEARDAALGAMGEDIGSFHIVELAPAVVTTASQLLLRYALRAGDAIQLASCLALTSGFERPPRFVSFDRRLKEAAQAEGLAVTG